MAKKHQFFRYLDYSCKLDNESIPQEIGTNEVAIESFNEIQKIYLKEVLQIEEKEKVRHEQFDLMAKDTT